MKPTLISGIQPTGPLHLGNYLGALKNFVELQNSDKYECYFFIADYHSLTEEFDPQKKGEQILDLAKSFLAAGLDGDKSTIFVQSHVPQTTELMWILSTLAPFGELSRMTQFKEKSDGKESANIGLFTYPILMAADIMLYGGELVPVGDDQLQHLEFARTLARKFNNKFGETLKEPKALLTKTPRIMSLSNPLKKMSKSEPKGCLFLNDSSEIIKEKIMTAVTDSGKDIKYDPQDKPAISNLLEIESALSEESAQALEKIHAKKSYAEFKKSLGETIVKYLAPIQEKAKAIDEAQIKNTLKNGRNSGNKITNKTLKNIKEKLGLDNFLQ